MESYDMWPLIGTWLLSLSLMFLSFICDVSELHHLYGRIVIPLCVWIIVCSSVHPLMDTWVVALWSLWIVLL